MIIIFEEFDKERKLISLNELDKLTISYDDGMGFFVENVSVHLGVNLSPEDVKYLYGTGHVLKLSLERVEDEDK